MQKRGDWMIYITGDTHIPHDIGKLATRRFPEQKRMTKDDFVIICGDFGGVWEGEKDNYWLDWLEERNFTTLFVDGNHENFDLLDAMPVEVWNGGKVHKVRPSVIHLMRGQYFEIDRSTFWTMGGGYSLDKMRRKLGVSWWKQELPSEREMFEGLTSLELNDWKVDYILTHTAPTEITEEMGYEPIDGTLNDYLQDIKEKVEYKRWFFGHYHEDMTVGKHVAIYKEVVNDSN